MVNIFGEATTTSGGNSRPGKRGLPGKDGAPGRDGKPGKKGDRGTVGEKGKRGAIGEKGDRGTAGENASYYAQYFQYSKTEWDVDFKPNFWIDGHDIQENTTPFKVLNVHDHKYDAFVPSSSTNPTRGTDPVTGRYTLSLNGSQYLTCPMNWNTVGGSIDNLQVFIVVKYTKIYGSNVRECMFGNDNGGWDRVVGLYNNEIIVGGTTGTHGYTVFSKFPDDADPRKINKFCVLSIHWNNKGEMCGADRSCVWCNGKHIGDHFTAADVTGDTSFSLGSSSTTVKINNNPMTGEIGRFLVCGNRTRSMSETEIKRIHKYLMKEWKINEKPVFDICKWMPHFTLTQFRENEERCCLLISNPNKDLSTRLGQYLVWKSRSKRYKKNALSITPSKKCIRVRENKWALTFSKSLYKINRMGITSSNCMTLCVTFQLSAEEESNAAQQYIFTDNDTTSSKFRALSVSKDEIRIHGVDNELSYISIPYKPVKDAWTTILIEWLGTKNNKQGIYTINNENSGVFIGNTPDFVESDILYLGGKYDGTNYLNGSISSFESIESTDRLPKNIKTLIVQDQMN